MGSRTTANFWQMFGELSLELQKQAVAAYGRFCEDPRQVGLRLKKVHPTKPVYSARVSLDYRAVGVLDGDTMVWFWIGPHRDYDALLQRL